MLKYSLILFSLLLFSCCLDMPVRHTETCFTPSENCSESISSAFNSANSSIYCAFYDLDLDSIGDALVSAKSRGLDVKIILDDKALWKDQNMTEAREDSEYPKLMLAGIEARTDDSRSRLMHNKFCVIDERIVITGSFNPTERGETITYNNIVILDDRETAFQYSEEFSEMWFGRFGPNSPPGDGLNPFFCPEESCSRQLISFIEDAKQSLHCAFYSFTDEKISSAIQEAGRRGVEVKVIFDRIQASSQYSEYEMLKNSTVDVMIGAKGTLMHWKACIRDGRYVWTGSYNPSKSGDTKNDENAVIIDSYITAKEFEEEFERMWVSFLPSS